MVARRPALLGRRRLSEKNIWDIEDKEPSKARPFNRVAGEPVEVEGWENIYIYGMGFSFLTLAVGLYFKPETSLSEWAREEIFKQEGKEKYSLDNV